MALQLPLSLSDTLAYFAKYDYPLNVEELWYWQHGTTYSKSTIARLHRFNSKDKSWKARIRREQFSQSKWEVARMVGEKLKHFPAIQAVFVTGALAMNHCPKNDDIDFMIVTAPNTLWPTRFKVNLSFNSWRRKPNAQSVSNQPCFNLWLDSDNLHISDHDFYRAHEILQAKVLWDRGGVHSRFLKRNAWVKQYLPVAFQQQLRRISRSTNKKITPAGSPLVNWTFFLAQYLYMKSKMTTERVAAGYAYFHPKRLGTS